MYVIQGNVAAGASLSQQITGDASTAVEGAIIPAERCTWQQIPTVGGGYSITGVFFHPSNGTTDAVAVTEAVLGFIGKSGRFTPITN